MTRPTALSESQIRRLRDARTTAGLTVPQLAVAIGVEPVTVYRWEAGKAFPSPLALEKLAAHLPGVPGEP